MSVPIITVNTQYFKEVSNYYTKKGRYEDGTYGSYEYVEFWERELQRCDEGMTVGDLRITGDHYFYLNHWPIWLTRKKKHELYGEVFKDRVQATREFLFPDFWDVDLDFYTELELAKIAGEHFFVLKPRGTGFSNKGAGLAGKNYFTIPGSKSYMLADSKEFLLGDGIFNKWLDGRRHLNKLHMDFKKEDKIFLNPFGKHSDYKKDRTGMHFIASSDIDGEEVGYMSEVIGVAIDGDPDKARGKRGKLILLEEFGVMRKGEDVVNILRKSVEEGKSIFGMILGFGTGGTAGPAFAGMEKIVYSPQAYNVRFYPNKWDENASGTFISFFSPAYRCIDFKDSKGNSLEKEAKKFMDHDRELAAKSPDENALVQMKAENPYTPQEAILRKSYSVLPSNEAGDWYNKVTSQGLHKLGIPGIVFDDGNRVVFKPDMNLKPLWEFPHSPKDDLTGCVVQYFAPFTIQGRVPDDLYIIAHDPYGHDRSTDMNSIGATYVYMQSNNLVPPGDRIVATYFGRPATMDDYNKNLFLLADYYNAKIGFENDRGDVIGYAKRFKKLDRLEDEFELAFDADIPKGGMRRQYGMHMGSGRENLRIHKGNKYLNDWLITARSSDDASRVRLNLHTIRCPATLKEIHLYRDEGNFDRISALRILAYHMKELIYKERRPENIRVERSRKEQSFFNRKHFAEYSR